MFLFIYFRFLLSEFDIEILFDYFREDYSSTFF